MACLLFLLLMRMILAFIGVPENEFASLEGKDVILYGKVAEKEMKTGRTVFRLSEVSINTEEAPCLETELICYPKEGDSLPRIGSRIRLSGRLWLYKKATNPGQFDTYSYYLYKNAGAGLAAESWEYTDSRYSVYRESIWNIRLLFGRIYDSILSSEDAAVMRAVALGDKSELDSDLKELYRINGIAHILAISGLHISILGMGLYRALRKLTLPITPAAGAAVSVMLNYALLVGAGTSTVRAVTMFVIMCAADVERRSYDLPTALSLSAASTVFFSPYELMQSGFWMSYLAVTGIAIFFPALIRGMRKHTGVGSKLFQSVAGCAAVSAFTLPLIVHNYYEVPLYSMLLNLLVIPLMSVLMVSGLLSLLIGMISLKAGMLCAVPAHLVLYAYDALCSGIARLPYHSIITGGQGDLRLITAYLLFGSVLMMNRRFINRYLKGTLLEKKTSGFTDAELIPVRIAVTVSALWLSVISLKPAFRLSFIDVGQGDGICVDTEQGCVMIDGGSSSEDELYKYTLAPFLKHQGISRIDSWYLSHPDADHISGLEDLLKDDKCNIKIGRIILPDAESAAEDFTELISLAEGRGCEVSYAHTGSELKLGELKIVNLHPPKAYSCEDVNEYSQILLMEYGGLSVMLTGDATVESEAAALKEMKRGSILKSLMTGDAAQTEKVKSGGDGLSGRLPDHLDILKAGHHGSHTSSSDEWLKKLKPAVTVISCGRNNRYGHPHADVVERLESIGSSIYRTDLGGAVIVTADTRGYDICTFLP